MGRVRDDFESVNMRVHSMVNDIRTAKEMGADLCDPMAQVEMKLSEGFELLQVIPDRAGPPFASILECFSRRKITESVTFLYVRRWLTSRPKSWQARLPFASHTSNSTRAQGGEFRV